MHPHGRRTPRDVARDLLRGTWRSGVRSKPWVRRSFRVRRWYEFLSVPLVVVMLLNNRELRPKYGLTWAKKFELGFRFYWITRRINTGTTYRSMLAMASKVFELSPKEPGVLVEAGCFKGGSTACLSIIADIAGRDLIVYDSFEGLPEKEENDASGGARSQGSFRGPLDDVKTNVARHGVIERCEFRKGWFKDTMPDHREPVVLAYFDVDYQSSLHDCVLHVWPHLRDGGFVFTDEWSVPHFCALFWSERWWRTYFDTTPPGHFGSGTGIGLGQFWTGPEKGSWGFQPRTPWQGGTSVAYACKGTDGYWGYYPEESPQRAGSDEPTSSA